MKVGLLFTIIFLFSSSAMSLDISDSLSHSQSMADSAHTKKDTLITVNDSVESLKSKPDSLHAGKTEGTEIKLIGNHGLGLSFTFMIPIINGLERLRSKNENSNESAHMTQDATTRFDDNDIAWPIGPAYAWHLNQNIGLKAQAVYYQTSNTNKWTPNPEDSFAFTAHVNSYSIKTLVTSFQVEFNIAPSFITADGFQRPYLGLCGDVAPFIFFNTERTSLNRRIKSLGYGYSVSFFAGLERYISTHYSFCGELGYSIGNWGNFKDGNMVIHMNDIEQNGSTDKYELSLRALNVRFCIFRWY